MVIPVGWLFWVSFLGDDGSFSLENYSRMVESKSYARIFRTTFEVSRHDDGDLCILIGYPLAYFLSQLPNRIANHVPDNRAAAVLDLAAGAHLRLAGACCKSARAW